MQMFTIEMLPSLCRHCAKYHSSKQQPSDRNKECLDAIHFQKPMWSAPTITRKKPTTIEDKSGRNENGTPHENAMNVRNDLAYRNNDQQHMQCNRISMPKSQSGNSSSTILNGAATLLVESSKMNGLNNDVIHTFNSNGALDGQLLSTRSFNTMVTPSSPLPLPLPSPSPSPDELCCLNSHLHVHNAENPTSFTVKNDRLAKHCSDFNRCIDEHAITAKNANRSVRTVSANKSTNHSRKHAYVNHRWPYAISSTMNYSHVLLICIAFIVFGIRSALVAAVDPPTNASQPNATENGICSSKDIRNNVKNFNELKDCRVIEGFLIITLIDKYNESDYEGLEFPKLTEVTEFLLVYRVNGLKSLGKLFPNLRIIRGNQLIKDFSFIIFEMMHLQEIGLKALTKISRGSVRIEKNPALCFVDTIDWSLITSGSKENVIGNNKATNECPTCPGPNNKDNNNNDLSKINSDTSLVCPESTESKRRMCWNRQQCQSVCPSRCGNHTCNARGDCCNELCLTCADDDAKKCLSCQYLSVGDGPELQCVQKCPPGRFAHENRRCITASECHDIKRPVFVKFDFNLDEKPYIPRDGECSINCPSNHYPDGPSGQRECIKCVGSCKKECPPGSIESISSAQRYRGCTHIKGSFVISIRNQGGHNIVRELETFLSDIEVIEGTLSIIRSYPLLSLGFFKNLRTIKGDLDGKERFGLRVMENQNLQALFTQNVTIERGRLHFHFNPKLCMSTILELKDNVVELRNMSELPPDEVAPKSNGDKVACNVTSLQVTLSKVTHNLAVINLQRLVYEDERQLLGYLLYYMPTQFQNVTMFDGRDACGGDGWQVDDVPDNSRNTTIIPIIVTHLKPYTQYAYYIRTYTVASEQRGGISDIKYFRTEPYKPDPVTKLSVSTNGSSEITVRWGPPVHANGNLTKYVIKCSMVEEDAQLLEQRNYCNDPLGIEAKIPKVISEAKPTDKEKDTSDLSCNCDGSDGRESSKISDTDAEQLIEFEDELQNTVYVRQESHRRRRDLSAQMFMNDSSTFNMIKTRLHKRSANSSSRYNDIFPTNTAPTDPKTPNDDKVSKMDPTNMYYVYFYKEVNSSVNTLTLTQLKHYSYYSISVKACREGIGDNCGNDMIAYQRTGKIEGADDVTDVSVEKLPAPSNHSTGAKLRWNPPQNPNGIIVSYSIRYTRQGQVAAVQPFCIPHNLFQKQGNSHVIADLLNGNYSFQVMANSIAGQNSRWSSPVFLNIDEPTISGGLIALIVFLIILLLCGIGAVYWFYKRKYGPPHSELKLIASVNPEYVSMQYTPDEWEIPREKIIQLNELGQGSFGMVYEGIVLNLDRDHERVRCAIKTVNENATDRERINFLKEAAVMKAFDTHHVVRLLGVVSRGQPVLVIMELMVNGDLKGYLRSHRPESGNDVQPPTLRRILQMAIEIADGMAYLSAKKFVHRDLAARNCMVAEDLTVKIGDFGMTRDIYETDYYRKGTKGLLPVRWMAPESLKDGVFSSSSDVFSFGIVLWEMATLASQPYQGLSNDQVLRYVIDGGVMERPENCPERLYTLMCKTWQHRPSARPTFMQIVSLLLDEASPNFRQVSFYYSQAGQELLQLPQHQLLEVVDVRTPLRAEEENFSVGADDEEDPEDPNSFLMEKRNISQQSASASGPSNSPLR